MKRTMCIKQIHSFYIWGTTLDYFTDIFRHAGAGGLGGSGAWGLGGSGAVAPHTFLPVVHDVKIDTPSDESFVSFIYVKSVLVLYLLKLYPAIVHILIYSLIRNFILKLFRESTNCKVQ